MSNWSTYQTQHKCAKKQSASAVPDKGTAVLMLIILALAIYWLLSFFSLSIVPGVLHTARFIDLLAIMIIILIMVKFLSYEAPTGSIF